MDTGKQRRMRCLLKLLKFAHGLKRIDRCIAIHGTIELRYTYFIFQEKTKKEAHDERDGSKNRKQI